MADKTHIKILRKGSEAWNEWRKDNSEIVPDLSKADLSRIYLRGADLTRADLRKTILRSADLRFADLRGANLAEGDLSLAKLDGANLTGSNLAETCLSGVSSSEAIWPAGFSVEAHEFWSGLRGSGEDPIQREDLLRSVKELNLSIRSYNCLKRGNIQTIGDLVQKTESEILKIKKTGRKSLNEIREKLSAMGLSLGMRIDSSGNVLFRPKFHDFTVTFASELSPPQVKATLQALAEYYRACGGVGLQVNFELEQALHPELIHV